MCQHFAHLSPVQLRPHVESPDKWNDTAVRHLFIRHDETVLGGLSTQLWRK